MYYKLYYQFGCLFHFSLLTNDYMFSLIKSPFLPADFNILNLLLFLFLIHASIIKTDFLFGEINYNLSLLKICYLIIKDIKSKHKLKKITIDSLF